MKNIILSRKLWGATIGSILIILAVNATPTEHVDICIYIIGALFGTAIGGQAYKDIMSLITVSKMSKKE